MDSLNRAQLNFIEEARKAFAFLCDLGFFEVEALPTLIRYRKGSIDVDIYHGRQSYEIGAGVTAFGTRYAISEIIRHTNPELARQYRNYAATKPEGVVTGLEKLSALMKDYGLLALGGDSKIFSMLESERRSWSEKYALDILADQLRPQADEVFRQRDYAKAVELYSKIKDRLSPTELKKLSYAEKQPFLKLDKD